MSVLINIEMPTSCEKCQTVLGCCDELEDGTVWCRLAHGYIGDERTVCPLAQVPQHGRLIDADALIEWLYSDEPNALKAPFRLCTADRSDVIFLVKNAHTIIPKSGGTEDE